MDNHQPESRTPHRPRELPPGTDLASLTGRHEADARAEAASHGAPVRVLRRGEVHTMEYVEGRVNLVVDDDGRVERVFRG